MVLSWLVCFDEKIHIERWSFLLEGQESKTSSLSWTLPFLRWKWKLKAATRLLTLTSKLLHQLQAKEVVQYNRKLSIISTLHNKLQAFTNITQKATGTLHMSLSFRASRSVHIACAPHVSLIPRQIFWGGRVVHILLTQTKGTCCIGNSGCYWRTWGCGETLNTLTERHRGPQGVIGEKLFLSAWLKSVYIKGGGTCALISYPTGDP